MSETIFKPVTAITMGDPAGIGPEIVVGTMLDEGIHECCKPFVIGSIAILDRAAKVLGKELKYNKIEDPSEAKYEFGTVNVLETGDYDTDSIKWGEVQALAGQMAIDWIMKSIELGMAKKVRCSFYSTDPQRSNQTDRHQRTWTYRNLSEPDTFTICTDHVLMPQTESILCKPSYVTG